MPALYALAGEGDVQGLGLEPGFQSGLFQFHALGVKSLFKLGAHCVGKLAHDGTLLCGELAHLLEDGGQLALFAQILHAQSVKRGNVAGRGDGLERLFGELFELFFHVTSSIAKS